MLKKNCYSRDILNGEWYSRSRILKFQLDRQRQFKRKTNYITQRYFKVSIEKKKFVIFHCLFFTIPYIQWDIGHVDFPSCNFHLLIYNIKSKIEEKKQRTR